MPSAINIDDESKSAVNAFSDVDYYRRFYSVLDQGEESSVLVKFVAPKIIAYEEFRFYLLKKSVKRRLEPKYYYRPDYVSFDEYGTTNLWNLLLFINNIPTIEEFNKEEILVPTLTAILKISRDIVQRNRLTELVYIEDIEFKEKAHLYSLPIQLPTIEDFEQRTRSLSISEELYFNRDTFLLDIVDIQRRYVELTYNPVIESIVFSVKDKPSYIYGKHYYALRGSKQTNRITWNPRDIPRGIGLVSDLVEGDELEILYARRDL